MYSVLLDHRAYMQYLIGSPEYLPGYSQASVTAVHPANCVYLTLQDIKKHIAPAVTVSWPNSLLV